MINNRKEFREWLKENGQHEKECWLILKRGKPVDDNTFYYLDAVEEALCFGWIDSTLGLRNGVRMQRFSKRQKNSSWNELNKERVRRLEKLGLMDETGLSVLPDMHYEFDEEVINRLKQANVYDTFITYPSLYKRIRVSYVSNMKDKKEYEKALNHLIEMTRQNKMFGQWNDYGRLIEY